MNRSESTEAENGGRNNHLSNGHFAPGNKANPKGRPRRGYTIRDLLTAVAGRVPDTVQRNGKRETRTYREIASKRMWDIACYGDPGDAIRAYCAIRDSIDGRPKESMEISTPGSKPLEVRVIEVRE